MNTKENSTAPAVAQQRLVLSLRHYGARQYDPSKFKPITDDHLVKPRGGFWASPVGCNYGWREWCDAESFGDLSTHFDIEFEGVALVIDSLEDARDQLPWVELMPNWSFPLFQPLEMSGIDAVYLTERGQQETRFARPHSLYGWDCESVLVMNPKSLRENSSCETPSEARLSRNDGSTSEF